MLDEADRLLNMDFEAEIDEILKAVPADRRTFLFSATMTTKAREEAAPALAHLGTTLGLPSCLPFPARGWHSEIGGGSCSLSPPLPGVAKVQGCTMPPASLPCSCRGPCCRLPSCRGHA